MKVSDVYSRVNTKKNIFYSAYLKNKVQYNDVDPDKIQIDDDESPKVEELPDTEYSGIDDIEDPTSSDVSSLPVAIEDSV